MFWSEPLDPDVTDKYSVVVDEEWLDGETIISAQFTIAVESGVTISNISVVNSPEVSASFTGGIDGFWPVKVRIETPTRQRETCCVLWVKQGC